MAETTTGPHAASPGDGPDSGRGARASTMGGLAGALAMTSCCILPRVLVSFGVSGVWLTGGS